MARTAINLIKIAVSALCFVSLSSQVGYATSYSSKTKAAMTPCSIKAKSAKAKSAKTPCPAKAKPAMTPCQAKPKPAMTPWPVEKKAAKESGTVIFETPTEWEKDNNPWDNVPKDVHRIKITKGWKVPNTNTWITIGGMGKFDAYHDLEAPSGDPFEAPYIAPKTSIASRMNGNTKLIVRQSNINISTISDTKIGEIKSYLEADFAANNYFGDQSTTSRHYISLNSICLRLREVYVETNGFLFGQTATVFSDKESNGYTLILNGVTGNSQIRLPMLRYTWYNPFWAPENGSSRFSIAAEAATTDYLQYNGPANGQNGTSSIANVPGAPILPSTNSANLQQIFQYGNDINVVPRSRGVSPIPNITTQLRIEKKGLGHIAFRGLARYFIIRPTGNTSVKAFGWGLGVSTRVFVTKSDSIFFNYSAGRGLGQYIFDLPCQSVAYNNTTGEHTVQFAQGIILGFEHYWTEHVRSNVIAGMSIVNNAKFLKTLAAGRGGVAYDNAATDSIGVYSQDVTFLNHRIQQVTVNLMYKPTAAWEAGIEYTYAKRSMLNNQRGIAKRFQVSFIYRF